jgi:hypothetical protein
MVSEHREYREYSEYSEYSDFGMDLSPIVFGFTNTHTQTYTSTLSTPPLYSSPTSPIPVLIATITVLLTMLLTVLLIVLFALLLTALLVVLLTVLPAVFALYSSLFLWCTVLTVMCSVCPLFVTSFYLSSLITHHHSSSFIDTSITTPSLYSLCSPSFLDVPASLAVGEDSNTWILLSNQNAQVNNHLGGLAFTSRPLALSSMWVHSF